MRHDVIFPNFGTLSAGAANSAFTAAWNDGMRLLDQLQSSPLAVPARFPDKGAHWVGTCEALLARLDLDTRLLEAGWTCPEDTPLGSVPHWIRWVNHVLGQVAYLREAVDEAAHDTQTPQALLPRVKVMPRALPDASGSK